jgi:hypothetical protein
VKRRRRHAAGSNPLQYNDDDAGNETPLAKRTNIEGQFESTSAVVAANPEVTEPEDNFQSSYPYSQSSPYYEINLLLHHLHIERAERSQLIFPE